jgi:two-component system CheB/CheR fusion protein
MSPRKRKKQENRAKTTQTDNSRPEPEEPQAADEGPSFLIVGVGASAGGLEAFTQMLRALPVDTGMAFVLVQHLDPTHASMLTDILSRSTAMPVSEVRDQMAVEPNHVYVIPPGTNMVVSKRVLQLSPRREARGHHRSIDHFFRSLAETQGHKAIGVILSGTASDGTLGLQAIKAEGGITFAQDDTAQQNSMPRSAVAAGCVDFVLPPHEIAAEIARIGRHPYVVRVPEAKPEEPTRESNLGQILSLLRDSSGVDFTHYKHNTLYRRITRRMVLHKIEGLKDYIRFLEANSGELEALYQDILINVTSFFRNPEAFDVLKFNVFPKLLQERSRHDPVRVWVLGCSTGEEAYSTAIALAEFGESTGRPVQAQIFATDLNGASIERARTGVYSKDLTQDVSTERLRRFFVEVDGSYQIAKSIRDTCVFARHNVLSDPPFSRIDLISCRNLLIYLEQVLQQRLIPLLHYALKPTGFLWLGASETIGSYRDLFELQDPKQKIYTKKEGQVRLAIDLPFGPQSRGADQPRSKERLREIVLGGTDLQKEADRILLNKYAPPGVLVNTDLDILQFRGDTGAFLAPAPGKPSLNLLKMMREGLLVAVRAAVLKVKKEEVPIREEGLRVRSNGGYRDVNVEVIPVKNNSGPAPNFLILFEEPTSTSAARQQTIEKPSHVPEGVEPEAAERETNRLKHELAATREYLQSVIEQQEAANEELQSANEEVQSANEELQSVNEELETSKEEIQSSNEELATLNDELQHRNFELSQTNNDLVNLFSSVQMAMVMLGADLRIRRFTPIAEKILNLIPADVGRPITDIKLNLSVTDLDHLLMEAIDTVSVKEQDVQDKAGRWYSLRIRPYKTMENKIDGAVILLVDIDALKQNQEDLRRQAELLNQAHEPIFVWDFDGAITDWNKGAEETYQFTKDQAVGRVTHELLATSPSPSIFKEVLQREGRWTGEITHTRRDGQRIILESRMVLLRDPHGKRVVVEANRPITERKEREDMFRRRAEELAEMDRSKNEFLAMLAHELRNPLAPLRNSIEVLRTPQADAKSVGLAYEIIWRQTQNLTRMVEDLLDVSRVTQGKVTLRKKPVELIAILEQVAGTYRREAEGRGQTLTLKLPPSPVYVNGDGTRLEQIFGNLLNNASKYTPAGGHIWLTAETEGVKGSQGQYQSDQALADPEIVVRVSDDGIGLGAEVLPHIFELFMQSSRSLDRAQGGLGIGLTLAKELVQLHGGTIEVYSEGLEKGAEFVVRLPTVSAPSDIRTQIPYAASRPASEARRVLVVDDNNDEAESLAILMRLSNHEAEIAHSGAEALDMAKKLKPDVIFLDIGMPGMSGYEVASQLKQQPDMKAHLVALTGYGQDDDRRRAREAGFSHHFTKPVEPAALLDLVADLPPSQSSNS